MLQTLPLSFITRISPLNPRHEADDDVAQLGATIVAAGLKYPLIVWPRPDVADEFEVLDGGRRWRALKAIGEDGDVMVEIHEGDEASARLVALAVSVTPRALHPVAEFEAFAALVASGLDVPAIARTFNETERRVRQRLALAALSPLVRDLWRKGDIDRESAQAFTTGSIEAQEALVENWRGTATYAWQLNEPVKIREALRGDAMDAFNPVAKFILRDKARVEAYVAAGGRVSEDLFSEEIELRDAPIAHRVANDFLLAEAQRVAEAEGWGKAFVGAEAGEIDERDVEYTDEEAARVDQLSKKFIAARAAGGTDAEAFAEMSAIEAAATLRAFPPEERDGFGVVAEIAPSGEIQITRGVALPDEAAAEPAGEPPAPAGESGEQLAPQTEGEGEEGEGEAGEKERGPSAFDEPGKALRGVIDDCATKGLRAAVRARPDVALMLAVAGMGCGYGVYAIGVSPVNAREEPEDDELLRRIRPLNFADALKECAAAPLNDLTVAFARILASSIETQGATFATIETICAGVRARGADLAGEFARAIDRRGFFEAAPKEATLGIITGLIGAGEAKAVKGYNKAKLAEYATTLAREKGHVPPPLSNWAALPSLPGALDDAIVVIPREEKRLAQAMAEAIQADEVAKSDEAKALDARIDEVAAVHAAPLLAAFLRQRVHFGNEALNAGAVKAGELYEAYSQFVDAQKGKRLALNPFGEAIAALGVEKKRRKDGVFYLNIALRAA